MTYPDGVDEPADRGPPGGQGRRTGGDGRTGGRMQERVDQLREGGELLRPVTPHEFGRPDVTEHEFANRTYLVAKVEPLDVDGVRTIGIGALLWLVAFAALLPFWSALGDGGRLWWLWTCLAGSGLGLVGWVYCRRRRTHLRGHPDSSDAAR